MKFTKEQVEELVWEAEVETIHGENRRWSRTNTTIVEYEGKFYDLFWEDGLTEGQDNYYEEQDSNEVVLVEKTIVVKEWVEK